MHLVMHRKVPLKPLKKFSHIILLLTIAIFNVKGQAMSIWDAAEKGELSTVKSFVKKGINIDKQTPRAFSFFGKRKYTGYGYISYSEGSQWTPLIYAAFNGHADVVACLLKNGANPDLYDEIGMTPLMWAIYKQQYEVIDTLIANNVNLQYRENHYGLSPLMWTLSYGDSTSFSQILNAVDDCNIQDFSGETALHMAVRFNDMDALRLLIQNNANPNIKDKEGKMPIHKAALNGSFESIKELIKNGAKVSVKDSLNKTVLDYAKENVGLKGLKLKTLSENTVKITDRFHYQKNLKIKNISFVITDISDNRVLKTEGLIPAGRESAVGVTWIFSKPGLVYHNDNYSYTSKVDSATISFLSDGVLIKGFEIKNIKDESFKRIVSYIENVTNK